jgi:hypothetical protein
MDGVDEQDTAGRSFWHRMYARAVFALIEGATYRMMYHAYMASERPDVSFSAEERQRLENAYDFNEPDDLLPVFINKKQFLDDVEFAVRAFARVHNAAYILPIHRGILLKEIAHLRQSYQYCQTPKEVEVYPENVDTLMHGCQWFIECLVALMDSCADSIFTGALPGDFEEPREPIM